MGKNKGTLCWICANAYAHKCEWMKNYTPVNGWEAQKTVIHDLFNGDIDSYKVIKCPNFIPDKIFETFTTKSVDFDTPLCYNRLLKIKKEVKK